MSNIQRMIGILGFVVVLGSGIQNASADCPAFPTGFTCKCNGDDTRWVCAKWGGPVPPVLNLDFTVSYTGNIPRVEFIKADDAWELYSEVISSGAAADLGDVLLASDVSPDNGSFTVTIKNGAAAGALNVTSIVLDSTDVDWVGVSNLGATTIDGHVTGAITLVDDGAMPDPQGGEVTGAVLIGAGIFPFGGVDGPITITKVSAPVTIYGSVVGPITISKVSATVLIFGDYGDDNASHNIDLGVIANNAGFSIGGDFRSKIGSAVTVDVGSIGDATTSGSFLVSGSLTNSKATVTIAAMVTGGVKIGGDFGGTLDLKQGVPGDPESSVTIGTLLSPSGLDGGKVKLNNKDVDSIFTLGAAQSGTQILNGRQVNGVFYPCEFGGEFAGQATFTGVAAGGVIYTFDTLAHQADFSGSITITGDYAGNFEVEGDFTSTASLTINGDLKTNSGADGLIEIEEAAAGAVIIKGDLIGHVECAKIFTGSVTVEGNVASSGLFKTGAGITGETHSGALTFQGNVVGDILVHGSMSGDVTITGYQSGDLTIDEDLRGSVTVGGALANGAVGGGRILVTGESSGTIKVGKKTGSLTLIHLAGGLGLGATIEINTTEGNFNAEGAIYVGAGATCVLSPPDVTFDGCIRIYDHDPSENFGNLEGAIRVSGCHNAGDLNICVDGSDNGNVNICQNGCTNQVGWSCPIPACP